MPLTAPLKEVAPIWFATAPIWTEVMTPNGIATRIVGSRETRVMNHAWSMNSLHENRRATMSVTIATLASTARTTRLPLVTTPLRERSSIDARPDRPANAMELNGASPSIRVRFFLHNGGVRR